MNEYLEEWNKITISTLSVIKPVLVEHLENFIIEIDCYILDRNQASLLWTRNPFLAEVDDLSENVPGLEEVIDLHHDEFH